MKDVISCLERLVVSVPSYSRNLNTSVEKGGFGENHKRKNEEKCIEELQRKEGPQIEAAKTLGNHSPS